MKIKASLRSALMVAAGIWLGCAGSLHAQETTTPATAQQATAPNPLQRLFGIQPAPAAAEPAAAEQPGRPIALNKYRKAATHRRHARKASRTHRPSRDVAAKDTPAPKASAGAKAAASPEAIADADNAAPTPMPASVADARAEAADDTPAAANAAPPAPDATAKAETDVVAADQLNEVDRAMAAQPALEPAPTLALASVAAPEPITTGQAASAGDDHSGWARASLIGKIFIGFGGLLTLASALRMLIA